MLCLSADARESVEIVNSSEIKSLRSWRKLVYFLSAILLVSVGFNVGEAWAHRETRKELDRKAADVGALRGEVAALTAEMGRVWSAQRDDMRLVTTWAEYVKQRDDLVSQNKKMQPINGVAGLRPVQQDNFTLRDMTEKK